MLTVYHGSTCRIEEPLAGVCRPNLDFGIGFYVTDLKEHCLCFTEAFLLPKTPAPLVVPSAADTVMIL